jgi:hypothetical protein
MSMRVELWSAEISREVVPYRDTRTIDQVSFGKPLFQEYVDLPIDRVLVVGRPTTVEFPMQPGSLRRYFSADGPKSGVSKRSVAIFHNESGWRVETDQPSGFTVQDWGSHTSAAVRSHEFESMPTSVLIYGRFRAYWALLQPGQGDQPAPRARGQVLRADMTDPEPSGYFPIGTAAHAALLKAGPALRTYYGQYLEWPPRPEPERAPQVPPGYTGNPNTFALDIRNLRVHAAKFGYIAKTENGREPGLVTWLTRTGNLPFDEYHTDSRLGQ